MNFWQTLGNAIFTGDREWAWRRRMALASGFTMLACILNSTFWDHDLQHSSMVMTNAIAGLGLVMTIYVGGSIADAKFKRDTEQKAIQP